MCPRGLAVITVQQWFVSFGKEKGGEREKEKEECRSSMQREEERAAGAESQGETDKALTIGRLRKLDVCEGILFNRMRTLAGDSCPSARPHINLLCVHAHAHALCIMCISVLF